MRRLIAPWVAIAFGLLFAATLQAQHHHHGGGGHVHHGGGFSGGYGGGLYRGAITNNDYYGGHRHIGAHSLNGYSGYGGYSNYGYSNYGYGGYSGYSGYSSYRPYYNNWAGNVSINIGRPYYSSYGYGGAYNPYYYGSGYYGGNYYGTGLYGTGLYGTGLYGGGYYGGGVYSSGYLSSRLYGYGLGNVYDPYYGQAVYGLPGVAPYLGTGQSVIVNPVASQPTVIEREVVRETAKPVVTEIDWTARAKADRFIEQGDTNFKAQKFHDALLRYKMAIEASPKYAVAHLRHGFSLIANRRYEEASKAFAKAFALDPQIAKSGFRIDQLYADNRMAREAHQEALAQAALDEDTSGELHFVVGTWLLFSGEADRSRKFFEKARDLGINADLVAQASGRDL
jgi:Tfp pilus assembly protein PilF